jgi:hypothetical protein
VIAERRETYGEHRPAAEAGARRVHGAAMQLDDAPHQREADAQPSPRAVE